MDDSSKINGILENMTLEEKSSLCMGKNDWSTRDFPEHGIPPVMMTDGTNGVRFNKTDDEIKDIQNKRGDTRDYSFFDVTVLAQNSEQIDFIHPATCFPSGSAMACSWDRALIGRVAKAVAGECKKYGLSLLLSPGMNIRRSPLGGRSFEYFSEDPVVSGEIAKAYVSSLQENGVGGTLKHYTCNNSETLRTKTDSIVEERALREIYLAGFERALKAKPVAVMSSYNLLNGVQMAHNKRLLTDILRGEWGFEGFVISDWWAIKDRLESVKAGNDMEMPYNCYNLYALSDAVKKGEIDDSLLDVMCARILRFVFDAASKIESGFVVDDEAHHFLAREAMAESCVLLKNDGVLPLDPEKLGGENLKILVVGQIAKTMRYQGGGCALTNPTRLDVPYDEIKNRAKNIIVDYAEGYNEDDSTNDGMIAEAVAKAKNSGVVIMFAGLAVSTDVEGCDRTSLEIEPAHVRLIDELSKSGAKIVVVLCNGAEVTMPWLDKTDAVLEIFMCGQAGGSAVAQILFGDVNPSGKLTVTFAKRMEDLPVFPEFPGEKARNVYGEGIYVGYRYYEKKRIEPLFPFGFGLSYTTFGYGGLKLSKAEITDMERLDVSFTIKNTGSARGKEIAQLYVAPPACRLRRPVKELKGFEKIELAPGEAKTVAIGLSYRDFAYFDPEFGEWVVDTGRYEIQVGASSQDIRLVGAVDIKATRERHIKILLDTIHAEIFRDKKATDMYFDWLVEKGVFKRENINDDLKDGLSKSFVGLYNTLANHTDKIIAKEEFQSFLDRLNEELGR
jgi:beta-glucosidase